MGSSLAWAALDDGGMTMIGRRAIGRGMLLAMLMAGAMLTFGSAEAATGTITTVAGGGVGDGGGATSGSLYNPLDVAVDGAGNLYIADQFSCRVRKVSGGTITTAAGTSSCAYSGDGGAATSADLSSPAGITVDVAGDLYIADYRNCRVRKVSGGTITTVAGGGGCAYSGDGGAATSAGIYPYGVAVDGAGNLFIADMNNCRVRKVSGGIITTVAGSGMCGYWGDSGAATGAQLNYPFSVAVDGAGNLYIADTYNHRIREVSGGVIATVAGGGYGGDGGPATSAALFYPGGVAVDGAGNLYIGDTHDCRVREVSGGTITTVAGNGSCAYGGDGGLATSANLRLPAGIALDGSGNLYIADSGNCRIRELSGGTITTVAGNGPCGYSGDGGAATSASLNPYRVAVDGAGNLYIADPQNCRVRRVSSGTITTVAGDGSCAYSGDGGAATSAGVAPQGVAVDGAGNLYIADYYNYDCHVRKVSGGTITTVAGNGSCTFSGDGGAATSAGLDPQGGVAVDGAGNLYIADWGNCRVREVSGGTITTVAGNGACAYGGDGGAATAASLNYPNAVAVDSGGALYIADSYNCRVRKVSGGIITTVAGSGLYCGPSVGGPDDGVAATDAILPYLYGVAVDVAGHFYIANPDQCRVYGVSGGTITIVAGPGTGCTYAGDGGSATSASLTKPQDVAVDGDGDLYIADPGNGRVRKVVFGAASVGGIAEQPDVGALPGRTPKASDGNSEAYAVGSIAAAAAAIMAACAWLRRRHRAC